MSQSTAPFQPSNMRSWALRTFRKEKKTCDLTAIRTIVEPQGSSGIWKKHILDTGAQDSWVAYERYDYSESRLLHLPKHRKMLNSLTWDISFSLINNNPLMFRLPALFVAKTSGLSPSLPWCNYFRVTWDAVLGVEVLKFPSNKS